MVLGAQLFTLRSFIQQEADIEFSLAQVAKMGYRTVQVSAMGPIAPRRLRELCDKNGLEIAITHTPPDRIVNETDKVIEEHKILGCRYIGLGAMPEKYRDATFYPQFVKDYGRAARKIAKSGMLLMYHNHNFEFERLGGKRLIARLAEDFAPEEMGFTLDTYWVQAAGADVIDWIKRLAGRMPCVHLKDMDVRGFRQVMAPVLEGNLNFAGILKQLEDQGGTDYLLVEQDECEESPFVCLKKSYDNLHALGYR